MKRDKVARVQEDITFLDRRLLNILQRGLPLVERPFAKIGEELKMTEEKVMERVNKLKSKGIIRQINAIFDSSRLGYRSTLVAAKVDESQIDQVAKIINRHPGVSHNYKRDHSFNLWFTIAVPPQANLEETVAKLIGEAGDAIQKYRLLPALKTFKIQVMLDMEGDEGEVKLKPRSRSKPKGFRAEWGPLTEADKALIRELQEGFQIIERPFAKISERLGMSQAELFEKITAMEQAGLIRRFAAILHHRNAGFRANGMACWRVPEERIEGVGQIAAAFPQVSHCYQRPTYPDWPYNLFTMIHARDEEECQQIAEEISKRSGITDYEILFSTKEYKKTRVKYVQ